jgi:DNA-binding CsgD family transcriptional regulator
VTGKARVEGMLDAFEWLGYPALLLGRDGAVIAYNRGARAHLGSTIQVINGQLAARDRAAKEQLQQLIAGVTDGGRGKSGTDPSAVVLPRPSGPPTLAFVAPASNEARERIPELGAIILLFDPTRQREPAAALLKQAFGFTPAETRLALGLAKHHDLRTVAQLHNVTVGTLRVQLKSIFAKTNTKRQAQLLTLLSQLSLCPE